MLRAKLLDRLPVRLAGTLLLLSGITLVTLTELSRRAVERLLLQQAEVQAALSTAAIVDGLDAVIGSAERTARLVARELAARPVAGAAAEQRARDVLLDHPNFHACILVSNTTGDASAPDAAVEVHRTNGPSRFTARGGAGPDVAEWFREVLERAQPVWSEPFHDPGTGRHAVRVAAPIVREEDDEPRVRGAVAIVLDLEWLRRLANHQEFSDTSFTIAFSRSGRVLLHPKSTHAIAETMESLAEKSRVPELITVRQNILARRQGVLRYQEHSPARRVHVNYKPAKFAGWGVIVGFDEAEFLRTQRAYRMITFGGLGALLVLLAGIVILVTHLALRPLTQLALAAGEIAQRNLDCAVPIPRREDEVGRLARAFAAMRDALKAQHLERRWASQSMEHQLHYHRLIIDSMHEPVFVLTKTLRISRVNPAALRFTGMTEAALLQTPLPRIVRLQSETAATTTEQLSQALREERELHGAPAVLQTRDAGERVASMNLMPIRDSGRIVGAVVTLRLAEGASPETRTS